MDDTHNFDFPETRHSEIRRSFSDFIKYFSKQIADRLVLIGLVLGSGFLFFALYSYEPSDASLNTMPTFLQNYNWMGKFGAYSADLLIQFWGYASFLWVVILALWAGAKYHHMRQENIQQNLSPKKHHLKKSFLYSLLAVNAFACFLTILVKSTFLPAGSGGVFGMFFSRLAQTGVFALDIAQLALSLTLALFFTKMAAGENSALRLLLFPLQMLAHLWRLLTHRKAKPLPLKTAHIVVKGNAHHTPNNKDANKDANKDDILNIQQLIADEQKYSKQEEDSTDNHSAIHIGAYHYDEADEEEDDEAGNNLSFMRGDGDDDDMPDHNKLRLIHSDDKDVVIEPSDDDAYDFDDDFDDEDDADFGDDEEMSDEDDAVLQKATRNEIPADEFTHNQFNLPPLNLLQKQTAEAQQMPDELIEETARQLQTLLHSFKIKGEINSAQSGPIITLYEFEPAAGVKTSQVVALADDVARGMSADSVRIAPVSGKSVIGIELPNDSPSMVNLRDILQSRVYQNHNGNLPIVLGKDIGGKAMVVDLAKMPHLLIAGTTGSGKSVGVNAMILSLLYRYTPQQCRMMMIDPKMLELSAYNDIPHLLTPVVTDPKRAIIALKWAVREMERRYQLMSECNARNIINYNNKLDEGDALPYIAIIVDEMADLMLVAGKEIEVLLQRLAQMARAAGIHLITATQRPSVDVITGVIKANFPTRISYQVTSKFDSRTILGDGGAENLLGRGDMLFLPSGSKMQRIHGPFVADHEVEAVCDYWRAQTAPDYVEGLTEEQSNDAGNDFTISKGGDDDLYNRAVALILKEQRISISFIQRQLQIGYNRAARLVEQMEEEGIVSTANQAGKRQILVSSEAA
ncbi:MAG: DNA translocase FtsK [Alphaproteobacteria bacterium]|nr:DNA translocase FtsK [Alphaproteobacteria bacterium]